VGPVTAMVNNMMELLAEVPPMLVAGWVTWFVAGGVLAMWYRKASLELELAPAAAPRPAPARPKPAPRAVSDLHHEPVAFAPPDAAPVPEDTSHLYEPPPGLAPVATREKKPVVIGDPFGDLATLLDQPPPAAPAPAAHRAPGDSPILSSSGIPLRRAGDNEPQLG
jgi:hypothetical protein